VAGDFVALPRDNLWLAAMALLSEAIAALELPGRAYEVHAKLAPFQGRNVVLPTVAFLGPVELWLGILARVARRDAQALEWLVAARTRARRDGARPALARIAVEEAAVLLRDDRPAAARRAAELLDEAAAARDELALGWLAQRVEALRGELRERAGQPAADPAAASDEDAALRRLGDVWTLTCRGQTVHLNDSRGVRLLAVLLERPGSELHSLDLAAAIDGATPSGQRDGRRSAAAERDAAQAERARINVTRALRATLTRIAGYAPGLGDELALSVRTGTYCVYAPDPRSPLRWTVER
jgi:hypothetical protein